MGQTLRLGIAGLGNVGTGVIERLQDQASLRLNGSFEISGITARTRDKQRPVDLSTYHWFDDPVDLATSSKIDVFVELMGGESGTALASVEAALKSGKAVVTANKAMMAVHGTRLASLAKEAGVPLHFEAAVAGAIPIVRAVRESLAGTQLQSISGILNGTCNYVLCEMLDRNAEYGAVLKDAQDLGYAEADPFLDISGTDAAHKIALLATLGFGATLDFDRVSINGIDTVQLTDLILAAKFGYRIRLIAEATLTPHGILCRVEPVLLHETSQLAGVNGPLNAVRIQTVHAGPLMFTGQGAGSGPTASAVLGDLAMLHGGRSDLRFGPADEDQPVAFVDPSADSKIPSRYFIRLSLKDQAGALAALTQGLAENGISVDVFHQDSAGETGNANVAIVTHAGLHADVAKAMKRLETSPLVVDPARLIRIEAR